MPFLVDYPHFFDLISFSLLRTTSILRISFSSAPRCVEADCWNRAFPLLSLNRNVVVAVVIVVTLLLKIAPLIFSGGQLSKSRLSTHNDISANFSKLTVTAQRYFSRRYIKSIQMIHNMIYLGACGRINRPFNPKFEHDTTTHRNDTCMCTWRFCFERLRQNRQCFLREEDVEIPSNIFVYIEFL